jgi:hypothetical protein
MRSEVTLSHTANANFVNENRAMELWVKGGSDLLIHIRSEASV